MAKDSFGGVRRRAVAKERGVATDFPFLRFVNYVKNALAANPLNESIEDLKFLEISFRVCQPLIESLEEYHTGLEAYFSSPREAVRAKAQFGVALAKAKEAQKAAAQACPHSVDPIGGDIGAVRSYTDLLVRSIEDMQKRP